MGGLRATWWCVGALGLVAVGCGSGPETRDAVEISVSGEGEGEGVEREEAGGEEVTVAQLDGEWWIREGDESDFEGVLQVAGGRFRAYKFGVGGQQGDLVLEMTIRAQTDGLLTLDAVDGGDRVTAHARLISRDRMLLWADGEDQLIFAYRAGAPLPEGLIGTWSACFVGFDEFFPLEFTADAMVEVEGEQERRQQMTALDVSGEPMLLGLRQEGRAEMFNATRLPEGAWLLSGKGGYMLLPPMP